MMKKFSIPPLSLALYKLGFITALLKSAGFFIVKGKISRKILIMQILFTFVEALSIAALMAVGLGSAIIIIGMKALASISQESLVYPVLITLLIRELGPLLTAFIVIARSGTAIATEIAGMVVSHEIEAYISVGVDPMEHLSAPRFLGATISVFLLNIYFSIFGLAGSFLISMFFHSVAASVYFGNLLAALSVTDILLTIIKGMAFGMIMASVSLYHGFEVERASTEIPVAGLRSVTSAFKWCILADVFLDAIFYLV